jgi:YD repeat-containing protein
MIRGSNTYFYHYNGHGDVVALTDSTGATVAEYDYDAWGNPVSTGLEGTVVNFYRYAGYRWNAETGLYYLNASTIILRLVGL